MIPGKRIASGQLADFASVHGLTPVTVDMSFSLPRGQLREAGYPFYNTGYPGFPR